MASEAAISRLLCVVISVLCRVGPGGAASGDVTICTCDLTPGNCDLNCCCDSDCALSNPTSIFSFCVPGSTKAETWVCLYNWLIFRNNTPYTTSLVGSPPTEQFCVLSSDASLNYFVTPQTVTASSFLSVSDPYKGSSFSPASQGVPIFSSFYKAGDPILTVSTSSSLGILRQPAPVGAQSTCSDSNPAKFLQGGSTSCLRVFSNLTGSCETDLSLDSSYYYQDIYVLRVPSDASSQAAGRVTITSSVRDRPVLLGAQCDNVVSQVIYTVLYNGTQGITSVTANITLSNVTGSSLQQTFTVIYKSVTSSSSSSVQSRSGNPGYIVGYPVLSDIGQLSLLRSLVGESCTYTALQFGINALSGCAIRGTANETCSAFQTRAYQMLLGGSAPQSLAIYGNITTAQSGFWTRIIYQNCSGQGDCTTGCLIPVSLNMQIMWADVGLLSNPQAQLLGARFLFTCQSVKCQDSTVLQTQASFTDLTKRGPTPRGNPGVTGRDPTDFFFPFQTNMAVPSAGSLLLCLALSGWQLL